MCLLTYLLSACQGRFSLLDRTCPKRTFTTWREAGGQFADVEITNLKILKAMLLCSIYKL